MAHHEHVTKVQSWFFILPKSIFCHTSGLETSRSSDFPFSIASKTSFVELNFCPTVISVRKGIQNFNVQATSNLTNKSIYFRTKFKKKTFFTCFRSKSKLASIGITLNHKSLYLEMIFFCAQRSENRYVHTNVQ